jgi:hypothetical protein
VYIAEKCANVPKSFKNAIMSTPYGTLYKAIMEREINAIICYQFVGSNLKIVRLYDETSSSFLINDKLIRTPNVICGLPTRGLPKRIIMPAFRAVFSFVRHKNLDSVHGSEF